MQNLENEIRSSKQKAEMLQKNFKNFYKRVEERKPIFDYLNSKYTFKGDVLEIGAGSCWLSALISRNPKVNHVLALDLSKELIEEIGKRTFAKLEGNKNKIDFIIGDFNSIPFPEKKFDILVCDATLHHAQNISVLLQEINRVLKDDGFFLGVREPIKSILHQSKILEFGKREKKQGSTEMIYSKKEWKENFKNAGLDLEIIEDFSQGNTKTKLLKKYPFRFLNGILFSRYYFFAKKSENKLKQN